MAETMNNKPSIQIRNIGNGLPSSNGNDKSPSPSTKLLISHGKPNFTIPRSPKPEDNEHSLSPQPTANNNYNAFKSAHNNSSSNYNNNIVVGTKFNGVFKPSNVSSWASKEAADENEAAKVVLRRPKMTQPLTPLEVEDENVPEFIRRQRRIQERLAKENVLDFENRRSGYFTHVMISPDSPNRTSFVETMASPAIVPSLEMPAPLPDKIAEEETEAETKQEPAVNDHELEAAAAPAINGSSVAVEAEAEPVTNGHSVQVKTETEAETEAEVQPDVEVEAAKVVPVVTSHIDDVAPEEVAQAIEEVNKAVAGENDDDDKPVEAEAAEQSVAPVEAKVEVITAEPATVATNGHAEDDAAAAITISHTNGHTNGHANEPSIATPDPSGALGVNYEPKTVVSFAQELGGGENNYPDTVKVLKDAPAATPADAELQELTKLKFDIKSDDQNEVQVTPALRAD